MSPLSPLRSRKTTSSPLFAITALVFAATLLLTSTAQADSALKRRITLNGVGVVMAPPDLVRIQAGVISDARTAREALTQNSAKMKALIDALKQANIDANDIQTTHFSVSPRSKRYRKNAAVEIEGYRVQNTVIITVRKIDELGTILDQAVSKGANTIHNIQFDLADSAKLTDEARRKAFANAKHKAELYAKESGSELGKLISLNEQIANPQPRIMATRASSSFSSAVPIEKGGALKIEVRLNVVWELE